MPTLDFGDGDVIQDDHLKQIMNGAVWYRDATYSVVSGVTGYSVSFATGNVITPLVAGQLLFFKAPVANTAGTGVSTLTVVGPSGSVTYPLKKKGGSDLDAGDVQADQIIPVVFNSVASGRFELLVSAGINGTLPLAQGGTGATTASAARTNLGTNDAANLTTGSIPLARLASSPTSTTFLRGDQTWSSVNLTNLASGTLGVSLALAAGIGLDWGSAAGTGSVTATNTQIINTSVGLKINTPAGKSLYVQYNGADVLRAYAGGVIGYANMMVAPDNSFGGTVNDGTVAFRGGAAASNAGAQLVMTGSTHATSPGHLSLRGGDTMILNAGNPTNVSPKITFLYSADSGGTGETWVTGGVLNTYGGTLKMYATAHATRPNALALFAGSGNVGSGLPFISSGFNSAVIANDAVKVCGVSNTGLLLLQGNGYSSTSSASLFLYADSHATKPKAVDLFGGAGLGLVFSVDSTIAKTTFVASSAEDSQTVIVGGAATNIGTSNGAKFYLYGSTHATNPNQIVMVGTLMAGDNNIATGTTTGVKLATSASQKLGFWGITPVIQQTAGANLTTRTAAGTFGATEQTMLQEAHDRIRVLNALIKTIGLAA